MDDTAINENLIARSDEVQDVIVPVSPMPEPPPPLVEFYEVTKYFGDNKVLDSVNLTINSGEFLTLLGPSGCGKTTLLRILAGFEAPTSGQVFMDGVDITKLDSNKRHVNTVFQSYALFPHMNVFENVAFGLRMKKVPEKIIQEEVAKALDTVKMLTFATRRPTELSGGQQQRVAIARAFVNKPRILLLDEPLSALDHKLRQEMQLEIKELRKKLGISFLFVTHDQEEAFSMSDRVVVMNEGFIEQIGTPTDIYENPKNMFIAKFVGEINVFDGVVSALFEDTFRVQIEGLNYTLKLPKDADREDFTPRSRVKILLRPEDLRLSKTNDPNEMKVLRNTSLRGKIYDIIYKGMTVNIMINMPNGQNVIATQFFNEDATTINFNIGDYVNIRFVKDWEVILKHEE